MPLLLLSYGFILTMSKVEIIVLAVMLIIGVFGFINLFIKLPLDGNAYYDLLQDIDEDEE